jgi:hypothetical protein
MVVIQAISARIGRTTGRGIAGNIRISGAWTIIGWLATGVMAIASIVFLISLLLPSASLHDWRLFAGGIARFEASVTPLNASDMAFAQLLSGSTLLASVLIFSLCRALLHCRLFAFRVIVLHLHSPHGVFKETNGWATAGM